MSKLLAAVLVPAIGFSASLLAANTNTDLMKPYPPAGEKMQRNVMMLPALAEEQNYRVELIIGKEMVTDCNQVRLSGSVSEEVAKGWGYPYYQVTLQPGAVSTRMACPESAKKNSFVTLPAGDKLLRYNSKLPLVVYAPEDVTVSYRVWQAGSEVVASQPQ